MMIERLLPGETYEVGNVYVGDHKVLFARLVLYRLTENNYENAGKQEENEKKKGNRIRRKVEYYLG